MAYEEYLDDLLSGINNPKKEEANLDNQEFLDSNTETTMKKNMEETIENMPKEDISFKEDYQTDDQEILDQLDISTNSKPDDIDYQDDLDFLKAFDEELSNIEEDEFMKNFEWELEDGLSESEDDEQDMYSQEDEFPIEESADGEGFFTELDDIVNESKKTEDEIDTEISEEINVQEEYSDDEIWRQFISEDSDEEDEEIQDNSLKEIDRIGENTQEDIGNMDIMDILNNIPDDESLDDFEDMSRIDSDIESLASNEDLLTMDISELIIDHESIPIVSSDTIEEKNVDVVTTKKISEKKDNSFIKFLKRFNKSDDVSKESPEETILSDVGENSQILAELNAAEEEAKKKSKRKKGRKEKKEKKLRVPKPPKVVEPAEPSEPLPKAPVILILVLCASILFLILMTTNLLSYRTSISSARRLFEAQEYADAYNTLSGLEIKESDERFFSQVKIVMELEQRYSAYKSYKKLGMQSEALDALINAVRQYDNFKEEADGLGISLMFQKTIEEIEGILLEDYNLSLDQARELYSMDNKEVYTRQIDSMLK